jgi:hypothetical protein
MGENRMEELTWKSSTSNGSVDSISLSLPFFLGLAGAFFFAKPAFGLMLRFRFFPAQRCKKRNMIVS